ncbi:MAG: hypothetical protein IJ716_12815 [Lachnospiraceae bacterium]|nr:hypothetical protein [Lachnospiraceae bacterium]MBR1853768.1 hypothetical protein [Lachnospiraceae bacterium]
MTEKELNLARDLLPLYVEGKVSEDSARFVQSCMEKNEELREMYADMCREIEMPAERFIMAEGMPLYMNPSMARKRRNRRILRWVLPFVLLLLGYGGLLWGIIVYLFHMLSWGVL